MKKAAIILLVAIFSATFVAPIASAQNEEESPAQAGREAALEDFTRKFLGVPGRVTRSGTFGLPTPKSRALSIGLRYNLSGFILCSQASQDIRMDLPESRILKLTDETKEYRRRFTRGYERKYRSLVLEECRKGAWVGTLGMTAWLGTLFLYHLT